MKLRDFFIGKPIHWLLLVIVVGVLYWLGHIKMHVRDFNNFLFLLLALTAAVVLFIVVTYKKGDAITRDPLDQPDDE